MSRVFRHVFVDYHAWVKESETNPVLKSNYYYFSQYFLATKHLLDPCDSAARYLFRF